MSTEKLFSIVIPAYNEEDAISLIIEQCLNQKKNITKNTYIEQVEIIVVNDGSNDRTKTIAESYNGVNVISHESNLGFGTALKTGFTASSGHLIGFLDADGTCDPKYFVELINKIIAHNADIVIASRMGQESEMPKIRKVGNIIFATLINLIGNASITDSSSGFRVLKKNCLPKLFPLPNGLHFVTAMSTRAVLDENLKIVELPIIYKERVGESKLSVFKDGLKFLNSILEIGLTYEPMKFFLLLGILIILPGLLLSIEPIIDFTNNSEINNINYLIHSSINVYRMITILVFILCGTSFILTGYLAKYIKNTIDNHLFYFQFNKRKIKYNMHIYKLLYVSIFCVFCAILMNIEAIKQYIGTGIVEVNWFSVILGALLLLMGTQLLSFTILIRILLLYNRRVDSNNTM